MGGSEANTNSGATKNIRVVSGGVDEEKGSQQSSRDAGNNGAPANQGELPVTWLPSSYVEFLPWD